MSNSFRVIFEREYFRRGDTLVSGVNAETQEKVKLKVLQKPYRKWYRRLLQFITFGLYTAPYGYKVKLIKDE
jgi:hypothetical protein